MNRRPITTRGPAVAAAVGLAALLFTACATKGSPPLGQIATARASIAQAESAGALQASPVELLASRDKLGRAETALREERYEQARRLAEQAEVDAEVAERKTRAMKAQVAAAELGRSNEMLRQELERKSRP